MWIECCMAPFCLLLNVYIRLLLCLTLQISLYIHCFPVTSITLLEMGTLCNGAVVLLVSEAFFLFITLSYYHHLGRRSKKMWGRPATMCSPIWQNLVLDGWLCTRECFEYSSTTAWTKWIYTWLKINLCLWAISILCMYVGTLIRSTGHQIMTFVTLN